jgi:hypothetical protein
MRVTSSIACLGIACVGGAACANESAGKDEVIVADELRSAFYEKAPRALATAMSRAVAARCNTPPKAHGSGTESDPPLGWLCSGEKLHYLRSVYINGERGPHGLVCETGYYKYYGLDFVAELVKEGTCVPVERDRLTYELRVHVERDPNDA